MAASIASILGVAPQAFAQYVPGAVNDHVPLGTAYNRFSGKFLNFQTIKGEIKEDGCVDSSVLSTQDLTFRQLNSRLSGELLVKLDFPSVQANAGGNIALESASDDYSSNWVYSVINKSKSHVLRGIDNAASPVLSAAGSAIAADYASGNINNTELLKAVGTDYVSEIEYGSQLFVSMKMDFLNSTDKQNIGGYVSIDTTSGVVSVDGSVNVLSEEVKSSVKITVSAHQFGGDPLGLLTILPSNILSCDLTNAAACLDLFSNAVNYGKGAGSWVGNGFKDQVINLADANVIGYQTSPYDGGTADMYSLVPATYSASNNDAIIEQLETEYAQELETRNRAQSALKYYASHRSSAQRIELGAINQATTNNAYALASLADRCRDSYLGTDCANLIAANCPVSGTSRTCLESYDISVFDIPAIPPPSGLELAWANSENARVKLKNKGFQCTKIYEAADPWTCNDNYLCADADIGMVWHPAGPVANMTCTLVNEPADPHAWSDNYLCLPTTSNYEFAWAYWIGAKDNLTSQGYQCTQIHEALDPNSWDDNYLCHRQKL
ncbi:MAG: hypothetical protein ACI8WB_004240 [Phenylobacterium sp.]